MKPKTIRGDGAGKLRTTVECCGGSGLVITQDNRVSWSGSYDRVTIATEREAYDLADYLLRWASGRSER